MGWPTRRIWKRAVGHSLEEDRRAALHSGRGTDQGSPDGGRWAGFFTGDGPLKYKRPRREGSWSSHHSPSTIAFAALTGRAFGASELSLARPKTCNYKAGGVMRGLARQAGGRFYPGALARWKRLKFSVVCRFSCCCRACTRRPVRRPHRPARSCSIRAAPVYRNAEGRRPTNADPGSITARPAQRRRRLRSSSRCRRRLHGGPRPSADRNHQIDQGGGFDVGVGCGPFDISGAGVAPTKQEAWVGVLLRPAIVKPNPRVGKAPSYAGRSRLCRSNGRRLHQLVLAGSLRVAGRKAVVVVRASDFRAAGCANRQSRSANDYMSDARP